MPSTPTKTWSARAAPSAPTLAEAGVGRGDRVGVYLEKSWEAIVAMLAASRIGAAYVNVNPLFKAPQVEYLAGDCDIRVMIGDTPKLEELQPKTVETAFYRGARPEGARRQVHIMDVAEVLEGEGRTEDRKVSESDLGTILYTSGSTGMPKGVSTSQRNVVVGAQIVSTYLKNTPEDRILSALPLNFDAGMSQFTTSLRAGATLYLLRSRLPGDLLKALRRHEITGVTGVPPLWALLIRGARSIREKPLSAPALPRQYRRSDTPGQPRRAQGSAGARGDQDLPHVRADGGVPLDVPRAGGAPPFIARAGQLHR